MTIDPHHIMFSLILILFLSKACAGSKLTPMPKPVLLKPIRSKSVAQKVSATISSSGASPQFIPTVEQNTLTLCCIAGEASQGIGKDCIPMDNHYTLGKGQQTYGSLAENEPQNMEWPYYYQIVDRFPEHSKKTNIFRVFPQARNPLFDMKMTPPPKQAMKPLVENLKEYSEKYGPHPLYRFVFCFLSFSFCGCSLLVVPGEGGIPRPALLLAPTFTLKTQITFSRNDWRE